MTPDRWREHYAAIVHDFKFDPEADAAAARLLATLLQRPAGVAELASRLGGRDVHVVGASRALASLDAHALPRPLVATDGACGRLAAAGVVPDVIVTDLDGDVAAQVACAARGALVCVAAHGDNVPALRRWAPRLSNAIGTTQVPTEGQSQAQGQGEGRGQGRGDADPGWWPPPGIVATPGFTDGDRACFLAALGGAASVTLHAFDFETPGPSSRDPATKQRKLAWARRLLGELPIPWRLADAPHASPP